MSDSSEEEDLSRFQEAVDESFIKKINANSNKKFGPAFKALGASHAFTDCKPRSQRYLEEATHYNDVKVSKELQNKIGVKVSEIINRNLKFVNLKDTDIKRQTIDGGVKLFSDSAGLLSCEDAKDTYTENHNILSRKIRKRKWNADEKLEIVDEAEKIKSVAVSGDFILSKEETKCWKSRRKEKIYKYKEKCKSNVLTLVE